MNEVKYKLADSGEFIIENFNKAKAFSSFFPGIAGLNGIPLWAFYVNRGQCISSFGTKNKDGAILEFFPANQAYSLTALRGFRTFLKIKKGAKTSFYEPFRESGTEFSKSVSTKMVISASKLEIEEVNRYLGICVNVTYITVPNESFAALARRVIVKNISGEKADFEIVDGIPYVVSYGINAWFQKHMSRTIEAWVKVFNLEHNAPFYALKVDPADRAEIEHIERGNFYFCYEITRNGTNVLRPIVDPDTLFGIDGDLSYPRVFGREKNFEHARYQKTECRTPSAFSYSKFALSPGSNRTIISVIGNLRDVAQLNSLIPKMKKAVYFDKKLAENEEIISRLENNAFTKSSSDEFDFYCRQNYLDNLLRGGFPVSIDTPSGPSIFYTYGRKHGDLERDYNDFLLQPTYYSQGNGAYRDINQNRRNDVFFNPDVKYDNISTFINAIQPDGFNPHSIEGISFSAKNTMAMEGVLSKYINDRKMRNEVKVFLSGSFTPGGLIYFLETKKILSEGKAGTLLSDLLSVSVRTNMIKPGEGYWIDHWTYNIDLIESFLLCYSEELESLLLEKRDFTFYDTCLRVNPRDEKYVYMGGKVRQYGSVSTDEHKRRLIASRKSQPYKVRTKHGKGDIYKTNLFVILVCVFANKISSLDPFGIGVEMEAGKPGWCDSLNNLPGIFGSSVSETFELKRLILFLRSSLSRLRLNSGYKISFPYEIADLLSGLSGLLKKNLSEDGGFGNFDYWSASCFLKEAYRKKVWLGFDGREKSIAVEEIIGLLEKALIKVERGLKAAESDNGIPYTYFINEVKKYSFIYEKRKRKVNKNNCPLIKASSFSHKPVPFFLEGPVHAMRVAQGTKRAQALYKAVKKSELFDRALNMYKLNAPLNGMPFELGRQVIFTPGWLENESIWLHMEYKYLLEVLKKGLYDEFFSDLKRCLVAFQEPARYGRSILENSSFIVSSAYPDTSLHGNGFVARLTGSTTEFLHMWLLMCLGKQPFDTDAKGILFFELRPLLPAWLFTKEKCAFTFYFNGARKETVTLPNNIYAFCLFGKTLVVYHNPKRADTFGVNAVTPRAVVLKRKGEKDVSFGSSRIPSPFAFKIRHGYYDRIDVSLS